MKQRKMIGIVLATTLLYVVYSNRQLSLTNASELDKTTSRSVQNSRYSRAHVHEIDSATFTEPAEIPLPDVENVFPMAGFF